MDDRISDYVTRKVNRIGRHLSSVTTATVELALERTRTQESRAVAQVALDVKGTILRGEERGPNVMAAMDSVVDVMDNRVERYKGKRYKR